MTNARVLLEVQSNVALRESCVWTSSLYDGVVLAMDDDNHEARIAALAKMSQGEKKAEWRRLYGKPAPAGFGAGLLTRALAYRLQEKALGGLSKSTQRQLDQLMGKRERPKMEPVALKPGTWLSRTWHGEVHQVIVLESGFEYRGERYNSLTTIARQITGTGWSGPRFFGLRSPRLGKLEVTRRG